MKPMKTRTTTPKDAVDTQTRAYDTRLIRRMLPYVRPHVPLLLVSLGLLLLVSLAQLAQPYLIKLVIDGPLASKETEGLLTLALLYASAAFTEFALRFAQMYSLEKTGQQSPSNSRRPPLLNLDKTVGGNRCQGFFVVGCVNFPVVRVNEPKTRASKRCVPNSLRVVDAAGGPAASRLA